MKKAKHMQRFWAFLLAFVLVSTTIASDGMRIVAADGETVTEQTVSEPETTEQKSNEGEAAPANENEQQGEAPQVEEGSQTEENTSDGSTTPEGSNESTTEGNVVEAGTETVSTEDAVGTEDTTVTEAAGTTEEGTEGTSTEATTEVAVETGDEKAVTYVVSFDVPEKATVKVNGENVSSTSVEEGSDLQFTVETEQGYRVKSVKAGSNELTSSDGSYVLNSVAEDTMVAVEIEKSVSMANAVLNKSAWTGEITINGFENSIHVGDEIELSYAIVDNTIDEKDIQSVTWKITKGSEFASINGNLLTATGVGPITIEATVSYEYEGLWTIIRTASAQKDITIEERIVNVDNIVITNKEEAAELTAGDTIELTSEITPADATNKYVTWTSSDNSVATVDENGKVTAVAEGTATITVKAADGEVTDSVDISVKKAVIAVEKVKIEGADIVNLNSKINLNLIIEPEDAEIGEINWSSANEEVATVDNKGTVTGKAEGIVEIIVSVDGKEARKDITVIDPSSVKPVHTLTINYVYGEDAGTMAGRKAADTYYADVREGGAYKRTSPIIVGYQAEPEVIQGIMPENDLSVTVTYHPTETSYTVQHKFEQLDGSYVTENETKNGMYGAETEAEAKTVKGYEAGVVDNAIIGNDTVIVIEYTRMSYTVRFNSAGGSYVTAIEALYETPITLGSAQNPTRAGYIFDGWLNENGDKVTNLTLTENMLLTAAWKVDPNATANYKIMYWVQKAEGNEYDFLYSQTKNGKVGHTINSTDIPEISKSELSKINLLLEGFKRSKIDTDKIIQIDDSTIVNVYYDRKEFNLKFYNNKEDRNPVKTITARYGAWINDWPDDNLWQHFDGWQTFNNYAGMSTMPAENMNFFRVDTGKNSYKIYYMVEPIEGNVYIVHHIDSFTSSTFGWWLAKEDRYPITGFTLNPNDKRNEPDVGEFLNNTSSRKKNEIYYTRNSYLIEFSANGGYNVPDTTTYKYEAVITKPSGTPIREGYDFIGWYYDPGAMSRVEWGKDTMPANNMTVYAGWKIKTYPVVFDENYENGKTETTKVDYNHTVNEPQAPEREGYNFLGWFTQPEGGVKYDFGTPVKNGFTLYAHWSPKNYTSYTVKYLEQGTDNILHDQKVVSNQRVGKTVTEWAVDLEAKGYVAVQASQSMILAQSENVITFYYTNAVERKYTVTGIDKDTKEVIYGPEEFTTQKAAVWISAPEIKGYVLVEGQAPSIYRDIYLDAEKNNVVFEYERQKITYSVNYYVGGKYMSDWSETYTVKDGTQISNFEDKCPAGYHLEKTVPDIPTTITSSNRLINVYYLENDDITINYEATTGGSVSKASETLAPVTGIAEGSTATASAGYHFVNWTDKAGIIVSTEAAFVPEKVNGLNVEATYYANFEEDEDITITYVAEDGGTVTSSGETLAPATGVVKGSEAVAKPGYHFVSWTNEAKEVVSTDVKFTPGKVNGVNVAATYYANFEENESITINYVARTGGSVNPSSETLKPATGVAAGSTATASAGYYFVNWTNEADEEVGTDLLFVPEKVNGVNVAATYYANFAEKEAIVINYKADKNGTVTPGSEKLAPATGTATGSVATPDLGYKLVNWTNSNGEEVSTEVKFIPAKVNGLNVPETYTAHFVEDKGITKDLSYTVEYWVEGEGTARDSYVETAKVWINDPDTLQVKDIEMKEYAGYSFSRVEHVAAEKGFFQWLKALIPSDQLPETVGNDDTIKIIYTEDDVTIQYKADENGSVSLAEETVKAVTENAQGSTATAKSGYHFVNWTNEAGTVVSSDSNFVPEKVNGVNVAATYTAHFAENDVVAITYIARTGGSVDLGSEELAPATGKAQGSTASEDAGYTFVNWTNEAGDVVGTELTFVPDKKDGAYEEATYYANFAEKADVTINYEARQGGSVEPANETLAPATGVARGSVATAAAGYHFVSWTNEADEVVGTKAAFIPEKVDGVNVAATYYANFEEDEEITITYLAEVGGTVSRAREDLPPATGKAQGSEATAAAGYHFVNWTNESGEEVSREQSFIPEKVGGLNVEATYTAHFAQNDDVTIKYVAEGGGAVSRTSETLPPATGEAQGSEAKAAAGYHFVNWTNESGEEVSRELYFTPDKVGGLNIAATYTAHFAENDDIKINYVAYTGGSVNPESESLAPATGNAVGSTAVAQPGYHFVNWTNGAGEEVGTNEVFVPAKVDGLNVAATYYANFAENEPVTINYKANTGGSVTSEKEELGPVTGVAKGSEAKAAAGYHFVNWTNEAGEEVGTSETFIPSKVNGLNVAATYYANFEENESITINYVARTGGSVDPSSETLKPATGVATGSTATASAGYYFVNWTDEAGKVVGTDEVFVPEKAGGVNVAATYYANFAEKEAIVINYKADKNGTVAPGSEKLAPATGTATGSVATPDLGYKLVNWTNSNGEEVSTEAKFIPAKVNGLNVPETYTAHFVEDKGITKDLSYTVEYWVEGEGTPRDSYVETAKAWINDPDTLQVKDIEMKEYAGYSFSRVEHVAAEKGFFQWLKALIPSDQLPETVGNGDKIKIIYTEDDVTIQYKADENGSVGRDKETIKAVTGNAQGSTATADNGYHFVNWTNEAGTVVSSDSNFVPEKVNGVNVAATYTAHFAENDVVVITYIARTGGSVDLGSEELAPATGKAQGSTASEDAGYTFVNWTNEAGEVVGTELTFVPDKKDGAYEEATYYANFAEKADVTINYEARQGGSVEPANETLAPATGVAQGSVATAAAGYHFVSWTNEADEVVGTKAAFVPEKVDGVNVAATYYANFEEDEDITINYVARLGGSVTPESEELAPATGIAAGSTAAVTAGYHFVNWTDANGNEVGTDVKFVPEKVNGVNVAATYYANFAEDEDVTINYVANVGGSVTPEEETLAPATGNAVGSVAAVMSGYHFVNWTNEAGEEVGTELEFIPAKVNGVNVAATYYANFEENEAIDIQYVARIGGSVNPGNETLAPATGVAVGSTAMADAGYHFVNWTNEADEEVGTDLLFVPEKVNGVNVAATYYANFAEKEAIVINYKADKNGTVAPGSEKLAPATGTATGSVATPELGYKLVNWTNSNGEEVSTEAKFIPAKVNGLNVPETYTAHFEKDESITKNLSYTVEYWVEGEGTARDSYVETAEAWINDPDTLQVKDIEMKEYAGYSFSRVEHVAAEKGFLQWLKALIPSDQLPETVGNGDKIKIIYTEDDVTIQYKADENGSVSLAEETVKAVTENAQGSTAMEKNGYHFVNWTNEAGTVVSSDSNFVPEKVNGVNVAATYTAHFAENDVVVITYIARTGGSVNLGSEELAPATGKAQGSTASEDAGYTFVNWTNEAGEVVGTELTFVPDKKDGAYEEATYYANFEENEAIDIQYVARIGGSVNPGNETLAPATGVAVGSTAMADAGYHFVNWTNEADEVVGTDLAFVPEKVDGVNIAATYYANFEENENIIINYVTDGNGTVSTASESLAPVTGEAQGSTATANGGYHFVNWTNEAGDVVSTDAAFVPAKVDGLNVAATYTAHFAANPAPTPEDPDPNPNPNPTPDTTPSTTGVLGEALPPAQPEVGVLGEAAAPEVGVLGESKGPGTGDTAPIAGWSFLIMGAVLTLGITAKRRKKDEK